MLTVSTPELDLTEVWLDSDPDRSRLRVTFPINRWAGARDTAASTSRSSRASGSPPTPTAPRRSSTSSRARPRPTSATSAGASARATSRSSPRWCPTASRTSATSP